MLVVLHFNFFFQCCCVYDLWWWLLISFKFFIWIETRIFFHFFNVRKIFFSENFSFFFKDQTKICFQDILHLSSSEIIIYLFRKKTSNLNLYNERQSNSKQTIKISNLLKINCFVIIISEEIIKSWDLLFVYLISECFYKVGK